MAVKISELPLADALAGDELVPVVQGGVTRRAAASALAVDQVARDAAAAAMEPPAIKLSLAATTAMTSGLNEIPLTQEDYNTSVIPTPVLPSSRIVIPSGVSRVRVSVRALFDLAAIGRRRVLATLYEGGTSTGSTIAYAESHAAGVIESIGEPVLVAPGDHIALRIQSEASGFGSLGSFHTSLKVEVLA